MNGTTPITEQEIALLVDRFTTKYVWTRRSVQSSTMLCRTGMLISRS
jgi:hypothetical protein